MCNCKENTKVIVEMEKGFEELSLKGSEDYIAMITVACKPRE